MFSSYLPKSKAASGRSHFLSTTMSLPRQTKYDCFFSEMGEIIGNPAPALAIFQNRGIIILLKHSKHGMGKMLFPGKRIYRLPGSNISDPSGTKPPYRNMMPPQAIGGIPRRPGQNGVPSRNTSAVRFLRQTLGDGLAVFFACVISAKVLRFCGGLLFLGERSELYG